MSPAELQEQFIKRKGVTKCEKQATVYSSGKIGKVAEYNKTMDEVDKSDADKVLMESHSQLARIARILS